MDRIGRGQILLRTSPRAVAGALRRGFHEMCLRTVSSLPDGRPRIAFLPSSGPNGASLLRIWSQAEALRPLGWNCVVVPPWLRLGQRRRCLAALDPEMVIMQGARHPLNRPDLYPGLRILYDMDDADFHLPHLGRPIEEAMGQVAGVIAGSRYVADWCRAKGAREVRVIWTGAPVSDGSRRPQADRPPVIAWAQSRPESYGGEARFLREIVIRLGRARPGIIFRLFDGGQGADPAFARSFAAGGVTVERIKKARYRDYLAALDDVQIGFAPVLCQTPFVRGKSFGKVLAYLDRGVSVIATDSIDHSCFFTLETGVITNDPEIWIAQVIRLLDEPARRQAMADAGAAAFEAQLSSGAAARQLSGWLSEMTRGRSGAITRHPSLPRSALPWPD